MILFNGEGEYRVPLVSYGDQSAVSGEDSVRLVRGGWIYFNQPSHGVSEWLFDLNADRSEQKNLVLLYPEVVEKMRSAVSEINRNDQLFGQGAHADNSGPGIKIDPALAEQLRSLGYLQ